MRRRCFVISPIGLEGTEIREHADDLYDFIIKPAMDECDIDVFRSDHLREPGRISEQMFTRILNDDLCVAVLTGNNPNCFYELAIAQAAGRPVIILQVKGQTLPFDVQDLRCVYYDFKPRALQSGTYVAELVEHIRNLSAAGWRAPSIIGDRSSSQDSAEDELTFVPQSGDFGSHNTWLELARGTSSRLDLMGFSLGSWRRTPGFASTVKDLASTGCRVRVLMLHPDNPALPSLINDAVDESLGLEGVRQQMAVTHSWFAKLADRNDGIQVRQTQAGCPLAQITITDDRGVFIPYTFSDRTAASPLLECKADHALYRTLDREFESLWMANA